MSRENWDMLLRCLGLRRNKMRGGGEKKKFYFWRASTTRVFSTLNIHIILHHKFLILQTYIYSPISQPMPLSMDTIFSDPHLHIRSREILFLYCRTKRAQKSIFTSPVENTVEIGLRPVENRNQSSVLVQKSHKIPHPHTPPTT